MVPEKLGRLPRPGCAASPCALRKNFIPDPILFSQSFNAEYSWCAHVSVFMVLLALAAAFGRRWRRWWFRCHRECWCVLLCTFWRAQRIPRFTELLRENRGYIHTFCIFVSISSPKVRGIPSLSCKLTLELRRCIRRFVLGVIGTSVGTAGPLSGSANPASPNLARALSVQSRGGGGARGGWWSGKCVGGLMRWAHASG